jgi:hypothetical protein
MQTSDAHALAGVEVLASVEVPIWELAGARHRGGSLLAGDGVLAPAVVGQGSVLVGVEIWHVRTATLQTGTSPRCSRLDRRSVPQLSAAARLLYPLGDFVTSL